MVRFLDRRLAKDPYMSNDPVRFCMEWEVEAAGETLSGYPMASENIGRAHRLEIVRDSVQEE